MSKEQTKQAQDDEGHDHYDYKEHRISRMLTDFMVDHPYMMLGLCFAFVLLFIILFSAGAVFTGDASNSGQIFAIGELEVQRFLAHQAHDGRERDDSEVSPLSETLDDIRMFNIYSVDGDNVFTPQGVKSIWVNEQAVLGRRTRCPTCNVMIEDVPKFCQYREGSVADPCNNTDVTLCVPPTSPVGLFFPGTPYFDITEEMVDTLTQERIDTTFSALTPETLRAFVFFFDTGFSIAEGNLRSRLTRSLFTFGAPLCGTNSDGTRTYRNQFDDPVAQEDEHLVFSTQYTALFAEDDPEGITVNYLQGVLSGDEVSALLNQDFILAAIAGIFILVGIIVQTGSWFLGFFGIVNIGFAYPLTLFFYHGVFGFEFNTPLNNLAIFIILGIGADNVFIVTDTWKQSYHQGKNVMGTLKSQMNWTWNRAAKSMAVTSFTTMFAFVMTAVAPVPMVQTFGIFSALMVFWNYLLVITWYPTSIVLWNKKFEFQCWGKPVEQPEGLQHRVGTTTHEEVSVSSVHETGKGVELAKVSTETKSSTDDEDVDKSKVDSKTGVLSAKPNRGEDLDSVDLEAATNKPDQRDEPSESTGYSLGLKDTIPNIDDYRLVERYFYKIHAPYIAKYKIPVVALFGVLFLLGCIGSSFLESPVEDEEFLPESSELFISAQLLAEFPGSAEDDSQPPIFMYYGIDPEDPIDREGIDINDVNNFGVIQTEPSFVQNFGIDNQNRLVDICDDVIGRISSDGRDLVPRDSHICVMRDYKAWEAQVFGDETDNLQEITDRLFQFISNDTIARSGLDDHIGFIFNADGSKTLSHIRIQFTSPLTFLDGFGAREFWFEEWADIMTDINGNSPQGLNQGFQTSQSWASVATNRVTQSSTISSIIASFFLAFVVLVISSRNLYVASMAAFTILGIIVSIIGVFTASGAKLDLVRSVIYIMVVGLSVDYVVHLAVAFNSAKVHGRVERARLAILEIGISVLGASLTTMGSALFLFGAVLGIFATFGVNLFVTIILSLFWSTIGFIAFLMTFGPDDQESGEVSVLFAALVARFRAWRSGGQATQGGILDEANMATKEYSPTLDTPLELASASTASSSSGSDAPLKHPTSPPSYASEFRAKSPTSNSVAKAEVEEEVQKKRSPELNHKLAPAEYSRSEQEPSVRIDLKQDTRDRGDSRGPV